MTLKLMRMPILLLVFCNRLLIGSQGMSLAQLAQERQARESKAGSTTGQSAIPYYVDPIEQYKHNAQSQNTAHSPANNTQPSQEHLNERTKNTSDFQELCRKQPSNEEAHAQFLKDSFKKFATKTFCLGVASVDDAQPVGYDKLVTLSQKVDNAHEFFTYLRSPEIEGNSSIMNAIGDEIRILINFMLYRIPELDKNITKEIVVKSFMQALACHDTAAMSNMADTLFPIFKPAEDLNFVCKLQSALFDELVNKKDIPIFVEIYWIFNKFCAESKTKATLDDQLMEYFKNIIDAASQDNWRITPEALVQLTTVFEGPDKASEALIQLQKVMPHATTLMSFDLYQKYQAAQVNRNPHTWSEIRNDLISCGLSARDIDAQIATLTEYLNSRHTLPKTTSTSPHSPVQSNSSPAAPFHVSEHSASKPTAPTGIATSDSSNKSNLPDTPADQASTISVGSQKTDSTPNRVAPNKTQTPDKKPACPATSNMPEKQGWLSSAWSTLWGESQSLAHFSLKGLAYGKDNDGHDITDNYQTFKVALDRQCKSFSQAVTTTYRRSLTIGALAGLAAAGIVRFILGSPKVKIATIGGFSGLLAAGCSALYLSYRHGIHALRTGERKQLLVTKGQELYKNNPYQINKIFDDTNIGALKKFGLAGLAHLRGIRNSVCTT